MSKFYLNIPVDIDGAIAGLPEKSSVEAIKFVKEQGCVQILFSNDKQYTGVTFPVEWKPVAPEQQKGVESEAAESKIKPKGKK